MEQGPELRLGKQWDWEWGGAGAGSVKRPWPSPCPIRLPSGLCGGSASGKTTVATRIIEALDVPWVVLLSMDSFYKVRDGAREVVTVGLGCPC